MRYLVACPLDAPRISDFMKLRDEFKYLAPKWKITLGPHITIMRPGEAICEPQKAIDIFKTLEFGSVFEVSFKKFGYFEAKKTAVVYVEPSDYRMFEGIRANLLDYVPKIVKSESGDWGFHPHLTLINRVPIEKLELLMESLKLAKLNINYEFGAVVLYKKDLTDDEWVKISTRDLKKS